MQIFSSSRVYLPVSPLSQEVQLNPKQVSESFK